MPKFVVIVEHKCEKPLVMETHLDGADEETARQRMKILANDPRIIRVAIAQLVFVGGHSDLLPEEKPLF